VVRSPLVRRLAMWLGVGILTAAAALLVLLVGTL
jgi:hypothetical protein